MPLFVRFEAPKELQDKAYEVVEGATDGGVVRKGANEVTKAIERGEAKLVVMATDTSPEEILAHVPLLCEEKGIAYTYVDSKAELGSSAGLEVGTAAVAVVNGGRTADLLGQVVEQVAGLAAQ